MITFICYFYTLYFVFSVCPKFYGIFNFIFFVSIEVVGSEIFEETGNLVDGDVYNNNEYSQTCVIF